MKNPRRFGEGFRSVRALARQTNEKRRLPPLRKPLIRIEIAA
ncbi:MAG: hypothetical protein ACREM2_11755 [Vulcanimicrobiaceae bacterium]